MLARSALSVETGCLQGEGSGNVGERSQGWAHGGLPGLALHLVELFDSLNYEMNKLQ